MSRWIRGRLGRPMASILGIAMLVSLLLPLAPPPVQAQEGAGMIDWDSLTIGAQAVPVPLVVLEYVNKSGYKTNMVGRGMAAAMSISLEDTGKYTVTDPKVVQEVMDEFNFNVPLDDATQAMLADKLNCPYVVAGTINDVSIHRGSDGTYAEVAVDTMVVSHITRLPINGARVIQRSSPKIGFTGNTDALVDEAIASAAYQSTQRILDNRMPMGTVLVADRNGSVIIRGGSLIGLQEGMSLVAVRQESVSGILKVTKVSPTDCQAQVTSNFKGVAPSDKVVPVFTLTSPQVSMAKKRSRVGQSLAAVGGLALLYALIGHASHEADAPASVAATTVVDAGAQGFDNGAVTIRWSGMGDKVAKYIIYRSYGGSDYFPIAIVDGSVTSYLDRATQPRLSTDAVPVIEYPVITRKYEIEIDPLATKMTFVKDTNTYTLEWLTSAEIDDKTYDYTLDEASYTATCVDTMSYPGDQVSYRIRPLYCLYKQPGMDDPGSTHPEKLTLIEGDLSEASNVVTVTAPPEITWPRLNVGPGNTADPVDGFFRCDAVYGAVRYVVQLSSTSNFDPKYTESIPAYPTNDTQGTVEGFYSIDNMLGNAKLSSSPAIYVRMGVVNAEGATVYSQRYFFQLTRSLAIRKVQEGMYTTWPGKASQGRQSETRSRRTNR